MSRDTCEHFVPTDLHCDHCADDLAKTTRADPIVEAVRQKLHDRSQLGLKKYGTGLDRTDLTRLDWLRHLQEELMDACLYAQALIEIEELRQRTLQCHPDSEPCTCQ